MKFVRFIFLKEFLKNITIIFLVFRQKEHFQIIKWENNKDMPKDIPTINILFIPMETIIKWIVFIIRINKCKVNISLIHFNTYKIYREINTNVLIVN